MSTYTEPDLTLSLTVDDLYLMKAALVSYERTIRLALAITEETRAAEFAKLASFRRKLIPLEESLVSSVVDDLIVT